MALSKPLAAVAYDFIARMGLVRVDDDAQAPFNVMVIASIAHGILLAMTAPEWATVIATDFVGGPARLGDTLESLRRIVADHPIAQQEETR